MFLKAIRFRAQVPISILFQAIWDGRDSPCIPCSQVFNLSFLHPRLKCLVCLSVCRSKGISPLPYRPPPSFPMYCCIDNMHLPKTVGSLLFNNLRTSFLLHCVTYSQFHKTLPKSNLQIHWFSVRFYEMCFTKTHKVWWAIAA